MNRADYWISVAFLFTISAITPYLVHLWHQFTVLYTVSTIIWLYIYVRRLHDIGLSGWWGAAVVFGINIAFVFGLVFGGSAFSDYIDSSNVTTRNPDNWWFVGIVSGNLLIQIAFTLWLGIVGSFKGHNRFGPQPAPWRAPRAFKRTGETGGSADSAG